MTVRETRGDLTITQRMSVFKQVVDLGDMPEAFRERFDALVSAAEFDTTAMVDLLNEAGIAISNIDGQYQFAPQIATREEAEAPKPHRPDAGERARAKLKARNVAKALIRKVLIITAVLIVLFVASMIGTGYYLWQTKTTRYVTDERNCSVTLSGGVTITGKRSYSYPYHELLGIGWRETAKVDVRTRIDVPSKGITVMGLVDQVPLPVVEETQDGKEPAKKPAPKMLEGGKWWGFTIGQAEGGIRNLSPADTYIFVTGANEMTAVASTSFCR